MTNELHPGEVLTAETVGLLEAGHLLRRIDGRFSIHRIEHEGGLSGRYLDGTTHANSPPSHFEWIGRPNTEGWIDAPEGGWKTDPGLNGEVRLRDGHIGPVHSSLRWNHEGNGTDIVAFRLSASDEGRGSRPSDVPSEGGESDELDLYDDKVQEAICWTMRQWGEALGLKTWTQGDGSESVEGDVHAEIHGMLVDAGLRDPETNSMATLAHPQEADSVPGEGGGAEERDREWRENVESLLGDGDPDVIRAHEGGGPEDLILSLVLTMMRTRKARDVALTALAALAAPTKEPA